MAYNALNNLIDAYIYANGVQAITGQILNGVLKQMVSQLGSGYHLMGVAGPETVPASNDYAMAYFAATAGEYTDFGGITLAPGEVAVLLTFGNGSWEKRTIYNVPTGTADLENTANFITNAVTDLVNYYTKTEVDDTLANYPTLEALATALADYYTKQEIDTILAGYTTNTALASALADYYNKNDIDGLLSVVNAALADRYTKSETDTKLADYYKKTETYDKEEVDSIVAALSRQEYIVAWDGLAAPDVSAIPAGVTVTYSGTTYTGTLAASASTVNKIYMVWNGTAYDMYGTSQDGGYSWVTMGTTTVDLSQYATKAEVSQLEAKVDGLETQGIKFLVTEQHPGYVRNGVISDLPASSYRYSNKVPVIFGHEYLYIKTGPSSVYAISEFGANDSYIGGIQQGDVGTYVYTPSSSSVSYVYVVADSAVHEILFVDLTASPYLSKKSAESKANISDVDTEIQSLPMLVSRYAVHTQVWKGGNNNDHIVVPVNGGELVAFTQAQGSFYCAFLTAYKTPVIDETPDFLPGYIGRQAYTGPVGTMTIPTGTKFLVVNYPTDSGLSSLTINGLEVMGGVFRSLFLAQESLSGVKEDIIELDEKAITEDDFTVIRTSKNLANPENIEEGLIDSTGAHRPIPGSDWSMIGVSVTPGQKITFGGFYLGRTAYYAFYNDTTLVSFQQFSDPNGTQYPVTETVPAGANTLYIDIKTGDSPANPYQFLQINIGDHLAEYDEYSESISEINGVKLIGDGNGQEEVGDLIADLPVSDGTGISVGYAYIESSTGTVKVKMS